MLQKYLTSQSKLLSLVHKPKNKVLNTKLLKSNFKSNESIEKPTKLSNQESGSEYFPSTDSGKLANILIYIIEYRYY